MANRGTGSVIREIGAIYRGGVVSGLGDGELLARFTARVDETAAEAAFEAIVARHGPLVLGVCRRMLRDPDDVEDAFQATFLVLARRAGAVRVDDSLAPWLLGVARKVARRAGRRASARREAPGAAIPDVAASQDGPPEALIGLERAALVRDEVERLPARYRQPVVLCHLEGRSLRDAALELHRPIGTIKGRLARARALLRDRLARRGVDPAAPLVVPAVLLRRTARAGFRAALGPAPLTASVSGPVLALTEGVVAMMAWSKVKLAGVVLLSMGATAVIGGVSMGRGDGPTAPTQVPDETRDRTPSSAPSDDGSGQGADARGLHARSDPFAGLEDPRDARINALEAQLRELETLLQTSNRHAPGPPREGAKTTLHEYVVEPPDLIRIEVLEALPGRPIGGERLVRPDGKISLGFYGEVFVAGLTTSEVKEKVIGHLRRFLTDEMLGLVNVDPKTGAESRIAARDSSRVFVDVVAYNSKFYYMMGDVISPGRLVLTGNETVLDAVNHAGGLLPSADPQKIRLIRPSSTDFPTAVTLPVNLDAIINAGDTTTNYQLMANDRIVVDRDPADRDGDDHEAESEDEHGMTADPSPDSTGTADRAGNADDVERLARFDRLVRALERRLDATSDKVEPGTFDVTGAVHSPGRFVVAEDLRLSDALTLTGGILPATPGTRPALYLLRPGEPLRSIPLDPDGRITRVEDDEPLSGGDQVVVVGVPMEDDEGEGPSF